MFIVNNCNISQREEKILKWREWDASAEELFEDPRRFSSSSKSEETLGDIENKDNTRTADGTTKRSIKLFFAYGIVYPKQSEYYMFTCSLILLYAFFSLLMGGMLICWFCCLKKKERKTTTTKRENNISQLLPVIWFLTIVVLWPYLLFLLRLEQWKVSNIQEKK